jgi:hypothetical protein
MAETRGSPAGRSASLCGRSGTPGRVEPRIHPLQGGGLRGVPAGGAEREEPGVQDRLVGVDAELAAWGVLGCVREVTAGGER